MQINLETFGHMNRKHPGLLFWSDAYQTHDRPPWTMLAALFERKQHLDDAAAISPSAAYNTAATVTTEPPPIRITEYDVLGRCPPPAQIRLLARRHRSSDSNCAADKCPPMRLTCVNQPADGPAPSPTPNAPTIHEPSHKLPTSHSGGPHRFAPHHRQRQHRQQADSSAAPQHRATHTIGENHNSLRANQHAGHLYCHDPRIVGPELRCGAIIYAGRQQHPGGHDSADSPHIAPSSITPASNSHCTCHPPPRQHHRRRRPAQRIKRQPWGRRPNKSIAQ